MNEADRREKTMLDLFDWITDFVAGRDDVTADDIRLAIAREFADGPRERDALLAQYRERAEAALANIAELIDLIRLAHEWGANGIKGYDAGKAIAFQDKAHHILQNQKTLRRDAGASAAVTGGKEQ